MTSLTAKCSTIFVATRERTAIYHSVEEIPLPLREQLEESTSGRNSGTILIADKNGREELDRALDGLPSQFQPRLGNGRFKRDATGTTVLRQQLPKVPYSLTLSSTWLEVALPFMVAVALWMVAQYH
jgi:hypothetical protein